MLPRIEMRTSFIAMFFFGLLSTVEAKVDLDIWGTLTLRAGQSSPEQIKCVASGVNPEGSFLWSIGGIPLPPVEEKEEVSSGEYEQTYVLEPKVEYDGKKLKCMYIVRDERGGIASEEEDSVVLKVTYVSLRASESAGVYNVGDEVELQVKFNMHPKPEAGYIKWVITSDEWDEDEITIKTGETIGAYSVKEVESLGETLYSSSLIIDSVEEDEVKKRHTFVLQVPEEEERKIDVKFTMQQQKQPPLAPAAPVDEAPETPVVVGGDDDNDDDDSKGGEIPEDVTRPPYETTPEAPESSKEMGVGLFVIIAIVVLIVLVCVGYCVYQQCCKKKQAAGVNQTPSQMRKDDYGPVATTEDKNPA